MWMRLFTGSGRTWDKRLCSSFALSIYFCAAYYLLQRHPLFPMTAIKALWLDRMIPFVPGMVYLYESIWLLTPVAPWLMTTKAELNGYTQGLVAVSLMGFVVFFFHPTFCPRPNDVRDVNWLYGALIRVDWESNAFPSLHSALAVFHGGVLSGGIFGRAAGQEDSMVCLGMGIGHRGV